MPKSPDDAMQRFIQRVWTSDVAPLLRGERAEQRRKSARTAGKVAAVGGLAIDRLLGLRGRPFTRFMTVMGSSIGAMIPDAWDAKWFGSKASAEQRDAAEACIRAGAADLANSEALALFGLDESATLDELRSEWRAASQRWHPDHAVDAEQRGEFQARFIAFQSAYERLRAAYESGRLPRTA